MCLYILQNETFQISFDINKTQVAKIFQISKIQWILKFLFDRASKIREQRRKGGKKESLGEKNNEIVGNKGGIKYRGKPPISWK